MRSVVSRKERAAQTRRRMIAAACAVFSERGFAATTMDAVAAEAGVAVQTLYFTFHTKAELLQAAYEHAVTGPEQIPPHLSDWWRQVSDATDVREAVTALVDGTIPILERAAPLVWVVRADADAGRRTSTTRPCAATGMDTSSTCSPSSTRCAPDSPTSEPATFSCR